MELVYTTDLKSVAPRACGFKSRPAHQYKKAFLKVFFVIITLNMTKIIDGREIANLILESIAKRTAKYQLKPKLVIITYQADKRSKLYVGLKQKKASQVGISCELLDWSGISLAECKSNMTQLAFDNSVSGIIMQLPLNGLKNQQSLLDLIPLSKDVDGLSSQSLESLKNNTQSLIPATPKAILAIISSENISLENKNILIIGQGKLVGLPLGIILKNRKLKVFTADLASVSLEALTAQADIIVTATGSPGLLAGNMLKAGVIVLDAGASESGDIIAGDVEYSSVEPKVALISKVPGGIGPVTVACLLENVLQAAKIPR